MSFSTPNWFQGFTQGGLSLYFEVCGYNTDTSTRYAYLKNGVGTTVATASIVGTTPQRIRVTASSNVMLDQWSVELSDTSGSLVLTTAKLILIQDVGDYPLLYLMSFASIGTNASTMSSAAVVPANPRYWKYTASTWDGDLTQGFLIYMIENAKADFYLYMYNTLGSSVGMFTIIGTGLVISSNITSGFTLTDGTIHVPRIATGNTMYATKLYSLIVGTLQVTKALSKNFSFFQTNNNYSIYGPGGTYEAIAQKFTTTVSTSIQYVVFRVSRFGTTTDGLRVHLIEGAGTTGTVLAISETVSGLDISTDLVYQQYVIFRFSSAISLSATSDYTVSLERTGAYSDTAYYRIPYSGSGVSSWLKSGGTWSSSGVNFVHIFGPEGITKFESQYYIDQEIPYGLSTKYIEYEQSDWDGFTLSPYHSHDAPSSGGFSSKLVDVTANPDTDISNTTISGTGHVIAANPFTFPADGHEMATNNMTTGTTLHGSRVIVKVVRTMGSQTQKVLSALADTTGSFITSTGKKVSGLMNSAGILLRNNTKKVLGFSDSIGNIRKASTRTFTEYAALTSTMINLKVFFKTLSDAISVSQNFIKRTNNSLLFAGKTNGFNSKNIDDKKSTNVHLQKNLARHLNKSLSVLVDQIIDIIKRAEKRLLNTSQVTAIFNRVNDKRLLPGIRISKSLMKDIYRKVICSVQSFGSLIADHIQGVIQKEITALLSNISSAKRLVGKNLSGALNLMVVRSRRVENRLNAVLRGSGSFLMSVIRTLNSYSKLTSSVLKQVLRQISTYLEISSILDSIKVVLRMLSSGIGTSSSARKLIRRGIEALSQILSQGRRHVLCRISTETFGAALTLKNSGKELNSNTTLNSLATRMKVFLKAIVSTVVLSLSVQKAITHLISTSVQVVVSIKHLISRWISTSASSLGRISSIIKREIRSDLQAISNTIKSSFTDLTSFIVVSTTGFSAWKVVHTLYLKTISASDIISSWTYKRVGRIFQAFSKITGTKFTARSTSSKSERGVLLSATNRTINLEIRSQEGIVITMAYTGDTIRLYGRFYNWSGVLADVSSQVIRIYDGKGSLIITGTPNKESTGVYYFEYPVPSDYSDPLIYEMSGILEGATILARSTIERRWV